jgi:hypothetical protein
MTGGGVESSRLKTRPLARAAKTREETITLVNMISRIKVVKCRKDEKTRFIDTVTLRTHRQICKSGAVYKPKGDDRRNGKD